MKSEDLTIALGRAVTAVWGDLPATCSTTCSKPPYAFQVRLLESR